jgi:hypothetical protein
VPPVRRCSAEDARAFRLWQRSYRLWGSAMGK